MRHSVRRIRALLTPALALSLCASQASAQSATREACTGGSLMACVRVDLTAAATVDGTSLLIAVSHLGVFDPLVLATQPSMVWSLAFSTGRDADPDLIAEREALVGATGSATLNNAAPWTFVDYGDQWALMFPSWSDPAFTTLGIGSAVPLSGTAVDEFGNPWQQIGTTGADGAITFAVSLPYALANPLDWFQIIGLEAQSFEITENEIRLGSAGSCSPDAHCGAVPPPTAVPEPATLPLVGAGLLMLLTIAHRQRMLPLGTLL
ncbi:MAG: PEP-CTERM sorting domain-containing protein [Gemmatimonadaceae bacterium]|nr:PEP-CTERM sorting domain-containing protein [Gemmatimonadaceae bacterium]